MKLEYKDFEIEVYRDKNVAGDMMLFFGAYRKNDQWELTSGSLYSRPDGDTVRDWINEMKHMIDDFYENPDHYEDDEL